MILDHRDLQDSVEPLDLPDPLVLRVTLEKMERLVPEDNLGQRALQDQPECPVCQG